MVENKDIELKILRFLVDNDPYNRGIPENDFLSRFASSNLALMAELGALVEFPKNVITSHLLLMSQRNFIDYAVTVAENGRVVGSIKPAGYDFIMSVLESVS